MALVPYMPDPDIFFPGVSTFARYANYLDPFHWAPDLYHQVSRWIWESLMHEGRRQIGYAGQELVRYTSTTVQDTLARFFENARWAVSHFSTNIYTSLHDYYRELPKLKPEQARQLSRLLKEKIPDKVNLEGIDQHHTSAEFIDKVGAPGGANQRHTPDWMLPLILGLYGDLTPTWKKVVEEEEHIHGPSTKKKPKTSSPSSSTKAAYKRRHRSARPQNRAR
ncbi:minor structural protein VP3 [Betapolyomavirus ptedavyi]|nr:minor structural protein VP3 [Betapolyomavirus ptedavyi]AGA82600.1 minor structural protein VP3 [Betapolyomavirus ptedavyi]